MNSSANFLNKLRYQSNSTKKTNFIIEMNNEERWFRYGKEQSHGACLKVISTQGGKDNHEHPMLTKIHSWIWVPHFMKGTWQKKAREYTCLHFTNTPNGSWSHSLILHLTTAREEVPFELDLLGRYGFWSWL